MLLHSGSGLHRHEYSAPTSPTSPGFTRTTLVRSAFSHPAPRTSTIRYDTSIKTSLRPTRPSAELPRRASGGVSFVEQAEMKETETMSDDGKSVTSREGSEITFSGGRKKKKTPRPTTSYALAHPAPTLLGKQQFVHLRPQLLLQLQRVSVEKRPMPIIDVFPSALFVPRLAKKFPVMFKGRGGLGPSDIVCVKSENYGTSPERDSTSSDSDEEGWSSRDVEAVICQAKRGDARAVGQAEIVLSTGRRWTAVPLSSSIYEISEVDDHGLKTTIRWVRRTQRSNSNTRNKLPSTPPKTDAKFNFSILDPRSRRHPIIATMTPTSLDIPDTYTIPPPTVAVKNPASDSASDIKDSESTFTQEEPPEKIIQTVSESLRMLIRITGVWVALRQGWCPNFKYDDCSPPSSCRAAIIQNNQTPTSNVSSSHSRGRSLSLDQRPRHNTDLGLNGARAGTPESAQGSFSSAGGFSGKIKRLSGHRSPMMPGSDCGGDVFNGSIGRRGKPQRSVSAGTAFMAKVAARRMGNNGPPSTVASDSDHESLNNHSPPPPRRSVTVDVRTSLSGGGSNLSVFNIDDVRVKKRMSNPSPLGAHVEPRDDDKSANVRPISVPAGSSLAAKSAEAALAGKSAQGHGHRQGHGRKEKRGKWGRLTGLFRKKSSESGSG